VVESVETTAAPEQPAKASATTSTAAIGRILVM